MSGMYKGELNHDLPDSNMADDSGFAPKVLRLAPGGGVLLLGKSSSDNPGTC